jgi:hypothetical protein
MQIILFWRQTQIGMITTVKEPCSAFHAVGTVCEFFVFIEEFSKKITDSSKKCFFIVQIQIHRRGEWMIVVFSCC